MFQLSENKKMLFTDESAQLKAAQGFVVNMLLSMCTAQN